jgi:hypothetical protein
MGQNFRYNSITVDTINAGDPFGLNDNGLPTKGTPISQDAIEEYNISTANYDVATRRGVGATVNAVTKSGTNDFHGSAYFVYQNASSMVGENASGKKWEGYDKDRTLGLTFGGPIVKDTLFFFASFEKAAEGRHRFDHRSGRIQRNAQGPGHLAGLHRQRHRHRAGARHDAGRQRPGAGHGHQACLVKFDWNINDAHRASLRLSRTEEFEPIVTNGTVTGSSPRLALSSNWYVLDKESTSYALSFYDDWSDSFSTEASVGYNKFEQDRDPLNGVLPAGSDRARERRHRPERRARHRVLLAGQRARRRHLERVLRRQLVPRRPRRQGGRGLPERRVLQPVPAELHGGYEFNSLADFASGTYRRYRVEHAGRRLHAGQRRRDVRPQAVRLLRAGHLAGDRQAVGAVRPALRPAEGRSGTDVQPVLRRGAGHARQPRPVRPARQPGQPERRHRWLRLLQPGTIDGNGVWQPRASFNYPSTPSVRRSCVAARACSSPTPRRCGWPTRIRTTASPLPRTT